MLAGRRGLECPPASGRPAPRRQAVRGIPARRDPTMNFNDPQTPPKFPIWAVWALFALYALTGLVDHGPWRGDDAAHFGVIADLLAGGDWLELTVAGRPALDYPPLYYWVGALFGAMLGPLLGVAEAARLVSALCVGITLYCLALAARRFYGDRADRAAALLVLGTLGLLIHAHEFQPVLALLACSAAAFLGFAEFLSRPRRGALIAGIAIGCAFLSAGVYAVAMLMPLWLLLPGTCAECRGPERLRALLLGATVAAGIITAWAILIGILRPDHARAFWQLELDRIAPHLAHATRPRDLLQLFGWFLWPLWPLAGWALWRHRRHLAQTAYMLPLSATVLAILLVSTTGPLRPAQALPILPPMVLLAASGVQTLRRGAASAFDWFGRMIFALIGVFIWLAWYALHFGQPAPLARNIARLATGYVPDVAWASVAVAVVLSALWLVIMARPPRSPIRGTLSWAAGTTFLWALTVTLFMPMVDFDKRYADISRKLAHALAPAGNACIAEVGMRPAQWSVFRYHAGLDFVTAGPAGATDCRWLVAYRGSREPVFVPAEPWRRVWHFERGRKRTAEAVTVWQR